MACSLAVNNLKTEGDTLTAKERLKQIIVEKSLKKGSFILSSGAASTYLFDLKSTLLDPEGANLAAELVLEKLPDDVVAVGGLELGACPIVSAVCVKSFLADRALRAFYVRKEKKGRGTDKLIEGCELKAGDRVVILDDVTTKGGSAMEAIETVRGAGCVIVKIISIVDRLEGAKESLKNNDIVLESIFTKDDFEIA